MGNNSVVKFLIILSISISSLFSDSLNSFSPTSGYINETEIEVIFTSTTSGLNKSHIYFNGTQVISTNSCNSSGDGTYTCTVLIPAGVTTGVIGVDSNNDGSINITSADTFTILEHTEPVIQDLIFYAPDETLSYLDKTRFAAKFTDPNGDAIEKVKFLINLNMYRYKGETVVAGQIIDYDELSKVSILQTSGTNGNTEGNIGWQAYANGDWSNVAGFRMEYDGPINLPPVISNISSSNTEILYRDGQSAVIMDGDVNISDASHDAFGNYNGTYLILTRSGGSVVEDIFDINTTDVSFTIDTNSSGNYLKSSGEIFGTYTLNSGTLRIDFSGADTDATKELINNVLQHITFYNANNTEYEMRFNWAFSDVLAISATQASTIIGYITSVNIWEGYINDTEVTIDLETYSAVTPTNFYFNETQVTNGNIESETPGGCSTNSINNISVTTCSPYIYIYIYF